MEIGSLLNRHGITGAVSQQMLGLTSTITATRPLSIETSAVTTKSRSSAGSEPPRKRQRADNEEDETMFSGRATPIRVSPARTTRSFTPEASIVLIGIRGCGKRSLGFIAATALGRRFVTEDHYFQQATGSTRQDYLKQYGNKKFHEQDVSVSRQMLDENRTGCVIECGLGSLTSSVQEHLRKYSKTNPVVYLARNMVQITKLLQLEGRAAKMLEIGDPTHRRCSNYEYYNLEDSSTRDSNFDENSDRQSPNYAFKLKDVKEDFTYFVRSIMGANSYKADTESPFSLLGLPVDLRIYTHALQMRLSDFCEDKINFSMLESAGDAVEVKVDVWNDNSLTDLSRLFAKIRRNLGMPIVLTPAIDRDKMSEDSYQAMLEQAFRLSAEFVCIDLDLPESQISRIISARGQSRIIGYKADMEGSSASWLDQTWLAAYQQAFQIGCNIVRFVRIAASRDDNQQLNQSIERIRSKTGLPIPLVAYNAGPLGRTSQVFNMTLSPVTHTAIDRPIDATGPQITSREAVRALFQSFVLDPLKFYVLGHDVSYSRSPAMHNAAYADIGMSHTYECRNIETVEAIAKIASDPYFGGASIAAPFKVTLVDQLVSKSKHAEIIGAVNTVIPLRAEADGSILSLRSQATQRNRAGKVAAWYGDNTDWMGMTVCLTRNLSPRNVIRPTKTTGLVIGAGGMARAGIYAMLRMGCRKVLIFNRTVANAKKVADHFNSWASTNLGNQNNDVVEVLRSASEPWPPHLEAPTMIVACVPAHQIHDEPAAEFEIPMQWLGSAKGGVIIEMAYKPLETPMLKQMKRIRAETNVPWVLVDGLETLPESGLAQFELMTGRKGPRAVMKAEILKAYRVSNGKSSTGG